MAIQQVKKVCAPWLSSQTTAEIDQEISDELEFHLDMRMRDNIRAGMSTDQARFDAQQRFGDFESKRQACRQITLGPRIMIQRMQAVLFPILLIAVVYLGVRLMQMQAERKAQMESLIATIEQLQIADSPTADLEAIIPYRQWEPVTLLETATESNSAEELETAAWGATEYSADQPWSDWSPLDATSPEK